MTNTESISTTKTVSTAGIPLGTGVLLAWHPPDPIQAMDLTGLEGRWLMVHLGLLLALPLLALVIIQTLRGIVSRMATVSRVLIVPAATFYAAFDALVGIGTGLMVAETNTLTGNLREGAVALTEAWWAVPPIVGVISALAISMWAIAIATAGIAILDAKLSRTAGWLLVASSVVFLLGHPGFTGLIAMVALAGGVSLAERGRVRNAHSQEVQTLT